MANMTIKLEKSMFCRKEISLLGFKLTTTGLVADEEKLKASKNFITPEI